MSSTGCHSTVSAVGATPADLVQCRQDLVGEVSMPNDAALMQVTLLGVPIV
jgi:hypothetical protein